MRGQRGTGTGLRFPENHIEKCAISKMLRHIENLPQKMSLQENKYPPDTFHFYALSETQELQREKPGK